MKNEIGWVLRDAPSIRVPMPRGEEPHLDPVEWRSKAAWHTLLKTKYERAAHYPWLQVESDPPEPN
jgi:hypothetical protein